VSLQKSFFLFNTCLKKEEFCSLRHRKWLLEVIPNLRVVIKKERILQWNSGEKKKKTKSEAERDEGEN